MKTVSLRTLLAVFIISCPTFIQSQTVINNLDQVRLMKKFIGTWRCETGRDTTAYWEFRSFGTGIDSNIKYVTGGRIVSEVKALYGYDKRIDKFISALMVKGMDIGLFALWFLSETKYEIIFYNDLANPEAAYIKTRGEFKSPDLIVVTKFVNDRPASSLTYTRTD
ncbi:MAG: hypothetical protein Q8868_13690 [Bacteroidota bacterium]|nr:hypothetical protein [Bacteroidota bacterium]